MTTPAASIEFDDFLEGAMSIRLMIDGKSADACEFTFDKLSPPQKAAFMIFDQVRRMADKGGAIVRENRSIN